jgi:long-subunit acyl-CoA synthetase (AMP-forming)
MRTSAITQRLKIKPQSTCHTIYTSGSTGLPKVMIEHHSVINNTWVNSEYNVGANDRVLFVTPVGLICLFMTCWYACYGRALVLKGRLFFSL